MYLYISSKNWSIYLYTRLIFEAKMTPPHVSDKHKHAVLLNGVIKPRPCVCKHRYMVTLWGALIIH